MKKNYFKNSNRNCKGFSKPNTTNILIGFNSNWFLTLIVVMLATFNSNLYAQTATEIITTTGAGTWTSPAGITSFTVEAWGGGASGGGCIANTRRRGGSGGTGGTYTIQTYSPSSPTTYNYLVGAETLGSSGANGNNGSFSWFSAVGTQYATGGIAGNLGNGAAVTGSKTGSLPFATAIAGANTLAGTNSVGSAGSNGANGGGVGGGINTSDAATGSYPGFNGTASGGGGGGASTQSNNGTFPAVAGGTGARGEIRITYLKINSFGSTSGCVGSSITLNGTDFIGATAANITIGGTPVTSITSNTGTQIVAVIGAGTTGTVSITIAGKGTTTSADTFTVNTSPSISTQPVATSVCTTGSTAFNVVASGVITYQWRRNGVNLSNVAPYSNVTTATLTITNPALGDTGNFDVVLNSATCPLTSNAVALTVNTIPSASITPSPTTGATGVCYAGSGAITSVSWAATSTATSYDVYFGTAISPVILSANVTTNSYTTGALAANTIYYWRIVAKNSCGNATSSATWSFTTKSSPCYCTPTASSGVHGTGITNVSYSTVNNTTSNTIVYNDYTSLIGNVVQGAAMPISVTTATSPKIYNIKNWVDWNNDGDFVDIGEDMFTGIVNSNTINGTINVALTAILGQHTMRVGIAEYKNGAGNETPTPCFSGSRGAFEDYTINVIADVCVGSAPTVTTNPANSTVAILANTSFTAIFANTPTSYIWEVSSDGGTNYTTITNGGVYSGATTATLTITGVTAGMDNFKYRVSASNACGTSAVSTTATLTVTVTYCAATSTTALHYISGITSEGNLNDVSNAPTTYSVSGYGNYSSIIIATQIPGGGINIDINLVGPTGQFIRCYVDWNGNSFFSDTGDEVYTSGNTATGDTSFGFVVPVNQAQGNYRMRIRTEKFTNNFTSPTLSYCGTITSGETEDYTIAIVPDCAARIQSVTNGSVCGINNPVTISAVGLGGTIEYRWYTTLTGGIPEDTTTSGSYTTPSLNVSTNYYVTAFNGSCESLVRTKVTAKIVPTTSISFTPTSPTTCGEDTIITISAASDIVEEELFVEDFEGTIGLTVTTPTNVNGGVDTPWSFKTNTYQPTTTSVWRPAINSGSVGSNFGFTTSDYNNSNIVTQYTTTASFDATDFINLTLTFNHYYSYYGGDSGRVRVSTDGGTSWLPANIVATYNSDLGSASKFKTETIDLTTYAGLANIKLRFEYTAAWDDGWAIDDIRFFGIKQLNTSFTWSSATPVSGYTDISCLPAFLYTNQVVSTIYLKPDLSQLEEATYPITVTATLANGCPISQLITVVNNTKVWQGGTPGFVTDWDTAANWKPAGVPTANSCVIIPSTSIIPGTSYEAFAKNLTVKPTGNLDITSGSSLTVTDFVNVNTNGIFTIKNNASLVQINNVLNTGNITYNRIAQQKRLDYVYWSSPVDNFNISSHPSNGYKYSWNTTFNNSNGTQGNWVAASGIMNAAQGYIVGGPSSFNNTANQNLEVPFFGVPRNGNITIPIYRGSNNSGVTYTLPAPSGAQVTTLDDNWNLLGNPYPSAISCRDFLTLNSSVLTGALNIWSHGTLPSTFIGNPFYSNFVSNYNPNDYIPFNLTGNLANPNPDYYIGAGQGFFVTMIDGPAGLPTATVNYNNSLRSKDYGNSTGANFFRPMNTTNTEINDSNRIWLELNNNNQSVRTLVGYLTGATMGKDNLFDAISKKDNSLKIFSVTNEDQFIIQGRSLPFNDFDQVKIGVDIYENGQYSISIAMVDGLFLNDEQNIFLEDKLLNTIHNLREAPYSFSATTGTSTERFVLRYTDTSLGNPTQQVDSTFGFITNNTIKIQSTVNIKQIAIFDMAGKQITTYSVNSSSNRYEDNFPYANGVYIAKITLDNGQTVKKKLIH